MHYKILEKGITGGEVVKIQANYYAPKKHLINSISCIIYIKITYVIVTSGRPPEEKHSRLISVSSVVFIIAPFSIIGGSGVTNTCNRNFSVVICFVNTADINQYYEEYQSVSPLMLLLWI